MSKIDRSTFYFQINDSLTTLNLFWNGVSLLGCVALDKFLRRNENLKEYVCMYVCMYLKFTLQPKAELRKLQ